MLSFLWLLAPQLLLPSQVLMVPRQVSQLTSGNLTRWFPISEGQKRAGLSKVVMAVLTNVENPNVEGQSSREIGQQRCRL